jgi:hypothetical protein
MVKGGARIFRDQSIERFAPGPTGVIKDLFTKLHEFFNADYSDRFSVRLASLLIDGLDVDEFFEWHRTRLLCWIPVSGN